MSDLGERLEKAAVAPTGSAIQKRQNVANELKPICAFVEEMLEMAKRWLRDLTVSRSLRPTWGTSLSNTT
jgi:hypothetical protein